MARPTVASAAATTIIKIVKTCPVSSVGTIYREKATIAMLTAPSIISMLIRITTALLFDRAPYNPMANRIDDRIR